MYPHGLHEQRLSIWGLADGERTSQRTERAVRLPGRQKHARQVVIGIDEIRLAGDGELETVSGRGEIALRGQHNAEIVVGLGQIRFER